MGCPRRLVGLAVLFAARRSAGEPSLRAGGARSDDAYAYGSFDDAPAPARPDAAADVVSAAPARNASTMSWLEIARALFVEEGSTCLLTGGGVVPYFNSCVGCSLAAAQQKSDSTSLQRFESAPRDDRSSKNQPKRAENDRDRSL